MNKDAYPECKSNKVMLYTMIIALISSFILILSVTGCANTKSTYVDNKAPESFVNNYAIAIQALKSDDWTSMSLPLKNAKVSALNRYDGDDFVISTITVLQTIEQFSGLTPREVIEALDRVLDNRLVSVSEYKKALKAKVSHDQYVVYHESISKSLKTTNEYISSRKSTSANVEVSPFDTYVFKMYTQPRRISPSTSDAELIITTAQLITFTILELKNKNINSAYEALRTVTKIDTAILEYSGYIPHNYQLAMYINKMSPDDDAGIELLKISILESNKEYQEAYTRVEKWFERYPGSSNKRLGFAYFIYADLTSEINDHGSKSKYADPLYSKENNVLQRYMHALDYFNEGFGKGNLLSAVVEYKILNYKLGKMYKKEDAVLGISLINQWRGRYINNKFSPEVGILEDMLIMQLNLFHYVAGIPAKDPVVQQGIKTLTKMKEIEKSGDLNEIRSLMVEMGKQVKGGENANPKQFEDALKKYTDEVFFEKE